MRTVFLTIDYELYGDGSGDVFRHMIKPTDKIIDVCNAHNVKLTIFVEIVEIMRLKEQWESGNTMGYNQNPIEAIEDQLKRALNEGHDLQLHIHPQWVNAEYTTNGWGVDKNDWRLADFSNGNADRIRELIIMAKNNLEDFIHQFAPDYRCTAFRAGGYNAQPSQVIVSTMKEIGMHIDTSVLPGAVENGTLSHYDYSSVPNNSGMWEFNTNIDVPESGDMIELPVTTIPIRRYKKYLSWNKIRSILQNTKSAKSALDSKLDVKDNAGKTNKNKKSKLQYLRDIEYQTWDFCLFSKAMHRSFLKRTNEMGLNTLTLIGHPKSLSSSSALKYLINKMKHNGFVFKSFEELYIEQYGDK